MKTWKPMSSVTVATVAGILFSINVQAQDLNRRMEAKGPDETMKVNPEADKAYLYVRSEVPNLKFDSNRRIESVNRVSSGDWEVWLPAGTHILKIDADGFQRLELPPFNYARRRSYELSIKALGYSAMGRADEELIEVSFQLNQDSVYSSYGSFAPILSSGRSVLYRLPKGEYTFRFNKRGFVDQTHTISVSQPERVTIDLKSGASADAGRIPLPGFLTVKSEPSGAEVIVDGQRMSTTPYQAELTAGVHQLELRRPLYYPDISEFRVQEGIPIALSRTLRPRFGYFSVTANVPGSTVFLDGKRIGTAPVTREQIESARHQLRVETDLHHPYTEEFEIKDGDVKSISALLRPAYGMLEINSTPEEGADVYLDNRKVGVTPYRDPKVASGSYRLKVTKALFGDFEERITIADSLLTRRSVPLSTNFGTLIVKAAESSISLNGATVGSNTYTGRLTPGKYTVQATRSPRHQPATQEVFIAVGETREVMLAPAGREGSVSVMVEPMEASDAQIFVAEALREELKGNAPLAFRLLIGDYMLTAKKEGFLEAREKLTVNENDQLRVRLQMMTYEGSRQALKDTWGTVRTISGIAGLAAGGAAVYFKMSANGNYDKYVSATTTADALVYRQKTDDNDKMFKIALGAAAGLLTTALVSWIVQGGI
jgi:hypothetical protein